MACSVSIQCRVSPEMGKHHATTSCPDAIANLGTRRVSTLPRRSRDLTFAGSDEDAAGKMSDYLEHVATNVTHPPKFDAKSTRG